MPANKTALQIFVASPSDVKEERLLVDSVVTELNRTFSGIGVIFEVIKWETHVRPGISCDSQAVINSQVGDAYDIFIGIFWARIGTETPRGTSGTIEELESAIARSGDNNGAPEIMIYFKDAPIPPSRIDSSQLTSLSNFKNSLPGRGVLYSTFIDSYGFEASLRSHLAAVAQNASSSLVAASVGQPASVDLAPAVQGLDEDGLFDYIDIYTSRTRDMVMALGAINEATVAVGDRLGHGVEELRSEDAGDNSRVRRSVQRAADEMLRYAKTLDGQVSIYAAARNEAYAALSGAISLMTDFKDNHSELKKLRETLSDGLVSSNSAKEGILGMREAAARLPRMTKELNYAKRSMCTSIDGFVVEIDGSESTVRNIIDAIDRLLGSS